MYFALEHALVPVSNRLVNLIFIILDFGDFILVFVCWILFACVYGLASFDNIPWDPPVLLVVNSIIAIDLPQLCVSY